MEVIFLLIPLALVLVAFVVWAFWWAIRSGQFDDMEGPAHRILMDDEPVPRRDAKDGSRGKELKRRLRPARRGRSKKLGSGNANG